MRIFFVFSISLMAFFSCKPKEIPEPTPEPEVMLQARLQLMHDGVPVSLNQRLYTQEGYPFEVEVVNFFLTNVKNEDETLLDATRLALSPSNNIIFSAPGRTTDFGSLSAALGVVQPWNNADPVSFPSSSPLHLNNASDMHWGWAGGYIFYKFEGKYSSNPDDENLSQIFTYHMGHNPYLKYVTFNNIAWQKINDNLYEIMIYLHVDEIMNGPAGSFDISENNFSHATADKEGLNDVISTNFAHALRLD